LHPASLAGRQASGQIKDRLIAPPPHQSESMLAGQTTAGETKRNKYV